MKKIYSLLLFCFFITNVFAQLDTTRYFIESDGKKTERSKASYLRVVVKQEKLWEVYDLYLPNGDLQMHGTFLDRELQKREGEFHYFSRAGKLSSNGTYKNGLMQGAWKYWYGSGHLKDSVIYLDGAAIGQSTSWYDDGKTMISRRFDTEGKGNGQYQMFYPNGALRDSGAYINSHREGPWIYLRPDGSTASTVIYQKDSATQIQYFDKKGKPEKKSYAEKEASYKGGEGAWNQYLGRRITELNSIPHAEQYDGSCSILFAIDEEGNVVNIEAVDYDNELLAAAIKDMIRESRKWEPAIEFNLPAKAWRRQNFRFSADR